MNMILLYTLLNKNNLKMAQQKHIC